MKEPRYQKIKSFLLDEIEQGKLRPGDRVPSENRLARDFSVSRMTARRALHELADSGVLDRSQGAGSYVSETIASSSLLEIRNIADEITDRGHRHQCQVLLLEKCAASEKVARQMGLAQGESVLHSLMIHSENDIPVQWEERHVNPNLIPHYLEQDYCVKTSNAYLNEVAPLTEADHLIRAVAAEHEIAGKLQIEEGEPCLQITRVSRAKSGVVAYTQLIHPGKRFSLGGHLDFQQEVKK